MHDHQILQTGIDLYRAKEIRQAEEVFRNLIASSPHYAEPYHLLGVILHDQKKIDDAISAMERAVNLGLKDARCFLNLSVMLKDKGDLQRAESMCRQSLEITPEDPATHFHLATIQRGLNLKKAALDSFRKVLELNPEHPDTHLALGNLYYAMEDWEQAEAEYRLELTGRPENEAARINFASMEVARKHIAQARELYSAIPQANMHYSRAQTALAELERTDGNLQQAIVHHEMAMSSTKTVAADKISYATTLHQMQRLQESLDMLASVEREYAQDADTMSSVCVNYFKMDQLQHAVRVLEDIVKLPNLTPLVRTNAGIIYLTLGDYRQGWPLFASRIELIDKYANFPLDKSRRWSGESLDGKVLILVEEQGLGDTIQFVRFAAAVKQRYRCQIWFSGTTKLMGFMRSIEGVDRWLAQVDQHAAYDHWCPLPDLPWLLGMNVEADFKSPAWYMRAETERADYWKKRQDELAGNDTDLRIGIGWQGSKKYKGDHTRSYPLQSMKPLFSIPAVKWFSLQKGEGEEQLAEFADFPLIDLGREIDRDGNAFVDTSAVVEQLDLVIGCDSSLAHLAGAHGAPVWLALGQEPDWRWGLAGDSTCWYPATRLFRRSRTESWPEFFERMAGVLASQRPKMVRRVPFNKPRNDQSIEAVRAQAIKSHTEGRLELAEAGYREVLCRQGREVIATKQLAMIYAQSNRSPDAERLLRAALETNPNDASLHFYLGQILRLLQRDADALLSLDRASELDPKLPLVWTELAKLHQQMHNTEGVESSLQRAVEFAPDDVKLRLMLGEQYWRMGRNEEAAAQYTRAHQLEPSVAGHVAALAVCRIATGQVDEAIRAFRDSLKLDPRNTIALANLGATLYNRGELQEAKSLAQRALTVEPRQATALATLGLIAKQQDQHDEACEYFVRAYQADPQRAETKLMYAWTMHIQGDAVQAQRLHEEIERAPVLDTTTLNALGNYYRQLGNYDRALQFYQRAVTSSPSAATFAGAVEQGLREPTAKLFPSVDQRPANSVHFDSLLNMGLVFLAKGDFHRGWPYYCQREGILPFFQNHFPKQRWLGENLDGKTILVVAEQGLGDTIQFVRFAKTLKQRFRCRIVLFAQKPIIALLSQVSEVDAWVSELPAQESLDCWAYMMSLPYLLDLFDERDFSAPVPYLFADPVRKQHWEERLADMPGLRVGLAWKGSKAYVLDKLRSLPLAALNELAGLPGVSFVSLLKLGSTDENEVAEATLKMQMLDVELDASGAFLDTAAVIANLDLVITCDTSIAHLAGALGKEVWIALSVASDWRWRLGRTSTTWYPSAKLFRQQRARDWQGVIAEMATTLRNRISKSVAENIETPVATVVIPCFNGEDFIEGAIHSALRQKVPTEVIVVDDGSTDDSVTVVNRLIRNVPGNVSLLCHKNRGAAAARNAGLRLVKTKYVAFLDADDELGDEFMSLGVKFLDDNPTIATVSFQVELLDAYRPINAWQKSCIEGSLPGNLLLRTECATRIGGFPEEVAFRGRAAGEDVVFRRQLRIFGPLPKIGEPQYKYRVRQGSHLDFFLDRAYLHDGKTHVRYYTPEEQSGEFERAEHHYQSRVADRISQETRDQFARVISVLNDYQRLDTNPSENSQHTDWSLEGYLLYWLAQHWPLDGAIIEFGSIPSQLSRSLWQGNSKSKRGNVWRVRAINDRATLIKECPDAELIRETTLAAWSEQEDRSVRMLVANGDQFGSQGLMDMVGDWKTQLAERGLIAICVNAPQLAAFQQATWAQGHQIICFLESSTLLLVELSKCSQ